MNAPETVGYVTADTDVTLSSLHRPQFAALLDCGDVRLMLFDADRADEIAAKATEAAAWIRHNRHARHHEALHGRRGERLGS